MIFFSFSPGSQRPAKISRAQDCDRLLVLLLLLLLLFVGGVAADAAAALPAGATGVKVLQRFKFPVLRIFLSLRKRPYVKSHHVTLGHHRLERDPPVLCRRGLGGAGGGRGVRLVGVVVVDLHTDVS